MAGRPLLSPSGRASLHTYRYSGVDNSLVYKHLLSPLAQYCVDEWTPVWAACVCTRGWVARAPHPHP